MRFNLFKAHSPAGVQGKVIYVLAIVALIQTTYPISYNSSDAVLIAFQSLYLLMILAGIVVARETNVNMRLLIGAGLGWMLAGIAYTLYSEAVWAQVAGYVAIGFYQALIARVLLKYIFSARVITRDVLYAAVAVYLLIGAVFVGIFGTIESLTYSQTEAHAFSDPLADASEHFPWQSFVYYSYTTLTTLGYGDIQPITMWARSFASVEAVIGVMYVTIIMARLVGLYASREIQEEIAEYEEQQE